MLATDFKIGGAFYYDDYDNTLSEGIGRRKDIQIVPNIIFVSEAGMERLTKEPIISAIGVDMRCCVCSLQFCILRKVVRFTAMANIFSLKMIKF